MAPTQFTSPFPRLDLSADERENLHATAIALVDDAQQLYEDYLWEDRGTIDPTRWSLLRTREDIRVHHDRRAGAGTDNKNMHMLLTVGTVLGDLNDAMYGVLNHTTDAMRIKTAYIQDALLDSAVLATVLDPTVDEPFQSITVRWVVRSMPLSVRAVAKLPDIVYLEATGMKRLSNGEPVGYHLIHSVSFANTPPLPKYERYNMSMCTIWHQQTPQRVDAYQTCYVEIKSSLILPMIIKSTADTLLTLWKTIECAQMKKLAHFVGRKSSFTAPPDADSGDGCGVCGSHERSARRGAKSACAICPKAICKQCRVKRELVLSAPGGNLLNHAMRFCLHCLTTAHQLDAAAIAQHEIPATRARASSVRRRTPHHPRVTGGPIGAASTESSSTSSVSDQHSSENHGKFV